MIEIYDNDIIYREIVREIVRTEGDYNVTTIIENIQDLGLSVEVSVMESRIKTYLSNASKDIKAMVQKAKKVSRG